MVSKVGCAAILLCAILGAGLVHAQEGQATAVLKGTVTLRGETHNKDFRVEDTVVSVEGVSREKWKSPTTARVTMDQKNLTFVPHVLPILMGTTVDFPNSDPIYHNVFSTSPAKTFDLGLYFQGETKSVTFDKPGIIRIRCNTHPQMEAFVVVKDNPFFTVPDGQGNYMVKNVPLGSYAIQAWHPKLGAIVRPFALEREEEVLHIDFDLEKAQRQKE